MNRLIMLLTFIVLFILSSTVFAQISLSEEAQKHFDRGVAIIEYAETPEDFKPAIKEFEEAVRLAPDWPEAYYNLGLVQEVVGKFTEAILSFRRYLQLAPDAEDVGEVKSQINKLEYRAENVLTVADIIDVLVSFSNTDQWEKVGGECIRQPFEFIRRKDSNSVEFPLLYGLEWGPDERFYTSSKIDGPLFIMRVHTFCDAWDKQAYCHYWCDNEIEIMSRTHVRIRQQVDDADISPITPPVKNGTYICEYRKLDKSVDINTTDQFGNTPLHDAAYKGQKDVVELLIARGLDINVKNLSGNTPLHTAASWNQMAVAELLITKGADINAMDIGGATPLQYAEINNHKDMVELLKKHGGR